MKESFYTWMRLHRNYEKDRNRLRIFELWCKDQYGDKILDQWVRWTEKLQKQGLYV